MKWLGIVVLALVGIGLLVFAIGAALPRGHIARVRTRLNTPPDQVYTVLADVSAAASWRDDIERVEVLSAPGEPLRWRETGKFGTLTFAREEDIAGRRLVGRIADTSQGFGGRWIFELAPANGGTALTITEEGVVYNPLFRFMSRFVFGHYATMEAYVRNLGRHFGQEPAVDRVRS